MANNTPIEVDAEVIEGDGYRDIRFTKTGGFSISLLFSGILLVLAGIACLVMPRLSLGTITVVAGASFLATGVGGLAGFFLTGGFRRLSGWMLLNAIVDIVLGAMFMLHPIASTYALTWLLGLVVCLSGLAIVLFGVFSKGAGRGLWVPVFIGGILFEALGILIMSRPVFLSYCISGFALLYGIVLITLSFKMPKVVSRR